MAKYLLLLSSVLVFMFGCGRKVEFRMLTESLSASSSGVGDPIADSPVKHQNEVINALQPAIAVRGGSCLMCHAKIESNVITDFGYLGDGRQLNYFGGMGGFDDVYGDFNLGNQSSWQSIQFSDNNLKIIVPRTGIFPSTSALIGNSLADYLKTMRPQQKVEEASSVYIGAPTEQRLKQVFQTNKDDLFISDNNTQLVGLELLSNQSYRLRGTITCSGDLFVSKPIILDQVTIQTEKGCRIYGTATVFIQGSIGWAAGNEKHNLQITSSRAIVAGVGVSELQSRFQRGTYFFTRTTILESGNSLSAKVQTQNQKIIEEAQTIPGLKDASELPINGSRQVSFDRVLLNAPQIHSRYVGDFKGVIIGEIVLMSLGQFSFSFDPIFSKVPILPKLVPGDYLELK